MRLLLDITAHGFGHLAQCAPVVARLRQRGALELSVRSGLPLDLLEQRLGPVTHHIRADTDFGAVMQDAFMIDRAATLARYRALHIHLPAAIGRVADTLRALRCEVVLSNASYIATAAAAAASVPSVLFSSLTWHEVLRTCCPESAGLADEMLAAYSHAGRILRLVPGTAFHGLASDAITQPIARVGRNRRHELAKRIGADSGNSVALLAFAGIMPATLPPVVQSPGGFKLVGPAVWQSAGVIPAESTGLPFEDLLASVDIVVSKPGYGIVTELACAGTPAVLVARPDWPEEPDLSSWLGLHARCQIVAQWQGLTADTLHACLALPPAVSRRPTPGGESIVAEAICAAAGAPGSRPA